MKKTIQKQFEEYHEENPKIYRELVSLATQLHSRGRTKIGMDLLINIVRWNQLITTNGDPYKISNNFSSRYARLIMQTNPELRDIFNLRAIKSA